MLIKSALSYTISLSPTSRRVKEDVEKSLPPKEETILVSAYTRFKKKFYKAIYERKYVLPVQGTKPSNAPSLMNVMMELRKCCNPTWSRAPKIVYWLMLISFEGRTPMVTKCLSMK
jgi:hypothetical protein